MNKIWVYIDQFKGEALPASWETIGAAKMLAGQLGGGVTALVFGKNVDPVAAEAFKYGVDEVILADDPSLEDYRSEPFTALFAKLARRICSRGSSFPYHHSWARAGSHVCHRLEYGRFDGCGCFRD